MMIFRYLSTYYTFNFAQYYFPNELHHRTAFLIIHILPDFINLTYINIFYVKRLEKHISLKHRIPLNHCMGSLVMILSLRLSLYRVLSQGFSL